MFNNKRFHVGKISGAIMQRPKIRPILVVQDPINLRHSGVKYQRHKFPAISLRDAQDHYTVLNSRAVQMVQRDSM